MAGTKNTANAIYQVGKGDGVYLRLLNKDGTVKDWNFFRQWVSLNEDEAQTVEERAKVIIYNKLVRDNIPEIIMKSGKSCVVRKANN